MSFISNIKTSVMAVAAAAALTGCIEEKFNTTQSAEARQHTDKIVNTSAEAEEGELLVCLSTSAAATVNAGGTSAVQDLEGLDITDFKPVFHFTEDNLEFARKYTLDRWYKVKFEGACLNEAAVQIAQLGEVSKVQFNKKTEQNIKIEDVSIDDMRKIQADMIMAAQKFDYGGYDGIQLGLGNYYFLARFINPTFNSREDKYGGSTLNRLRIVLEIIKVIKKTTKLHVNCRLNAFDGTTNGMTLDETINVCQLLEKHGADSLQITRPRSPQFFTRESRDKNPLIDATQEISKRVDIPVILGGGATSLNQINDILNATDIDYISMQRPFVQDPSFLVDWQIEGNGESFCKTCNNCYWKKTSTCHIRPCKIRP